MRPLLGLTGYAEAATWGQWRDVPAVLVPEAYVAMLRDAGADVVVLPPQQGLGEAAAAALLHRLDGLVLTGGVDVEPARYGERPYPAVQAPRPGRDDAELALVAAAVAADLPLLGVCRGMQVLAVAAGGRLEQHLPDRLGSTAHSPGPGRYGSHAVRVAAGSWLAGAIGAAAVVATHHHQGVLEHPGYVPTAWADDGVLEAMEAPGARCRVGVQWHPEVGDDGRLFASFVAACAVPASGTRSPDAGRPVHDRAR